MQLIFPVSAFLHDNMYAYHWLVLDAANGLIKAGVRFLSSWLLQSPQTHPINNNFTPFSLLILLYLSTKLYFSFSVYQPFPLIAFGSLAMLSKLWEGEAINPFPHQHSISAQWHERERRRLYWRLRWCCHTFFSPFIFLLTWGPVITLVLIITSQCWLIQ